MRKSALMFTLVCMSLLVLISTVRADENSIGSGYAITSNYHGVNVPANTEVTATALTLNASITTVLFRWHRPDDSVAREVTVSPLTNTGTTAEWKKFHQSFTIFSAQDTFTPDVVGDWGVQAFFLDPHGNTRADVEDVVAIRATSFFAVPEIPLGTIGVVAAVLLAFGVYSIKNKKTGTMRLKP